MATTKVLVCLNNFKGSLTNREATHLVAETLRKNGIAADEWPIGDGGSGSMWALHCFRGGALSNLSASSPLSDPVMARVLCLPGETDPTTLYIESSQVCGYELIPSARKDPLLATSFGLGQLLVASNERWRGSLREILIGLGDSAISDVGLGMLSALGYRFLDIHGNELEARTPYLVAIDRMKGPEVRLPSTVKVTVLCDVSNPLCGPEGSARTFSPQKGASEEQVLLIERGMESFGKILEGFSRKRVRSLPRTGSAGGLSAALYACLNAELVSGAGYLFDEARFDDRVKDYDFVITGEGRTDAQTLKGKAPKECLERSLHAKKKILFLSGMLGEGYEKILDYPNVVGCFASGKEPDAATALIVKTEEIIRQHVLA